MRNIWIEEENKIMEILIDIESFRSEMGEIGKEDEIGRDEILRRRIEKDEGIG